MASNYTKQARNVLMSGSQAIDILPLAIRSGEISSFHMKCGACKEDFEPEDIYVVHRAAEDGADYFTVGCICNQCNLSTHTFFRVLPTGRAQKPCPRDPGEWRDTLFPGLKRKGGWKSLLHRVAA